MTPEQPKIRILVVDDTEAMRYATARLLRGGGYEVVEAGTGLEALEQARRLPDLIVLDIHLPDIDGYEVCRRLRSDPATKSIPVLHLTATYLESEDRAISLDEGADAFLKEPVAPRELLATVRALLRMKRAEKELEGELQRLENIIEATRAGTWEWNVQTGEAVFSARWAEIIGATLEELSPVSIKTGEALTHPDDRGRSDDLLGRHFTGELPYYDCEYRMKHRDGHWVWVHDRGRVVSRSGDGKPLMMSGTHTDITERKARESYLDLRRAVLQELNEPGTLQDSVRRVVDALKRLTGFDAVGIRLQSGDDFPYLVQDGFPGDFLQTENSLVERGPDGGICRNEDGSVRLECTCGLVISGKTDPASPLFTPGGSCWTNDSFPLLEIPAGEDPRLNPRNNCIHQGYASVALVPIRSGDRILGLIQLNDRRKGRLSLDMVTLLERLAEHIGTALVRKRAEEALSASEEQYRRLNEELERRVRERTAELERERQRLDETAQLSRVGGWDYDLRTNELTWTDVTYEIHEVERGVRQTVDTGLDYYAPESRPRITEVFARAVATGEPFDEELELITAKGRRIWVRVIGKPYMEDGKVVRVGGVFQDIQDRRTRMTMLEEANRELAAFSYSVSHELRSPLRAIDGFSAKIAKAYGVLLDDEGRRLFGQVRWNAQRMGQLVDDLLAFSRAGRAELTFGTVDMTGAAKAALALVVPDAAALSRISISVGDLPRVRGDAVLLLRVWANLLSNAVKFSSGRERPEIHVEGKVEDGEAVYRVRDNGVGFDMKYVDKLFGVFHRLHATHDFEGTGIGLALVRRVVVRHGGRVWAEGELDRGATFSFSLLAPSRVSSAAEEVPGLD